MATSHDSNERRPAIWPWVLMPIVVLIVFYTLQRFQDSAKNAAAQTQAHTTNDTSSGETTEQ